MPTFKPKNNKQITIPQNLETLDKKHSKHIQKFNDNKEVKIPKLREKKEQILKKYKTTKSLDERLEYQDTIKQIEIDIESIEKQENNYYLENSKHIFNYFEKKKEISTGKNKTRILNAFFNIHNGDDSCTSGSSTDNIERYMANIDENIIDLNNYVLNARVCELCEDGELIPVEEEGILLCNNCGKFVEFLIETEKPSYKEPPKEVCFYAYKKINHFREILAQFQAKETTLIPDKVITDIKIQVKKERIDIKTLTNKKAKDILKKLGYNKYYEHIPFIKDRLGIKPPIMTPELEETLCNLFGEIQAPYAKHCPDYRVNFLNYYYTIYKLCELLEQTQFLSYFPMLKDREKKMEQDCIWKKICKDMDWVFIPTV
jgi:hypothetical protein